VADEVRVYVFFGKSGVFAFDHNGRQLWQADVGAKAVGWGSGASPVLYKDLVIVNASVESESLVALDKKTGKEVWRAGGIKESWNTPILVTLADGKTELVLAILGKVLGFEPKSGEQLWSCATDIGWYMVPSLVAHEGVVYCIGGRPGAALAVRAGGRGEVTESHRLWTGRKGSNVSSPVFHEGHLYWMHDNLGIAYCAEAKTGRIVYQERLPATDLVYASALLADDKIYYVSQTSGVFVVAAGPRFELLAHNRLGDRSVFNASPAVAGGRLLLRSNRFLYCIGQAVKEPE
jgi:outer membrane protein assembly factor BamB